LLDEKNQEIIDEPFATAKSEGFPAGWTAKHFKASTTGGGDIIFGVRADLNFIGVLTPVAGVGLFCVGLKVLIPTIRKRILLDA
jgi:hypothetical protein